MDYVLTEHARDTLEKRRIAIAWLERCLDEPDLIEADPADPDLEHRLKQVPEFENRVLRVIVNANATPARIVTVFFDRRRSRE